MLAKVNDLVYMVDDVINELLSTPNITEVSNYTEYLENNTLNENKYGFDDKKLEEMEYVLAYGEELLIGLDYTNHDLLFVGGLNWDLYGFMSKGTYDTDEKFEGFLEDVCYILQLDYITIDTLKISGYDVKSDKIYQLFISEGQYSLGSVNPEEVNYAVLKEPLGNYGRDVGDIEIILERGLGKWNTWIYVFEKGAIKVASQIEEGSVMRANSEFIPLVCEEHWADYIEQTITDNQNEVVYTSEKVVSKFASLIV